LSPKEYWPQPPMLEKMHNKREPKTKNTSSTSEKEKIKHKKRKKKKKTPQKK